MSAPSLTKHYAVFSSPGTFFAEQTSVEVPSWDVERARMLAAGVKERLGATPYGFHFVTRGRGAEDLDSKVLKTSGMYYLGGKVRTLAEVEADNLPEERTLLSNMRGNGYERVVQTTKGWRWTQPLLPGDVVLED